VSAEPERAGRDRPFAGIALGGYRIAEFVEHGFGVGLLIAHAIRRFAR
jgi:hypothetical protein